MGSGRELAPIKIADTRLEMTSRTAVGRITLPCIGAYRLLDSVNEAEN